MSKRSQQNNVNRKKRNIDKGWRSVNKGKGKKVSTNNPNMTNLQDKIKKIVEDGYDSAEFGGPEVEDKVAEITKLLDEIIEEVIGQETGSEAGWLARKNLCSKQRSKWKEWKGER